MRDKTERHVATVAGCRSSCVASHKWPTTVKNSWAYTCLSRLVESLPRKIFSTERPFRENPIATQLSGSTQNTRFETFQPNWHVCEAIRPQNSSNSKPGLEFDELNSFGVELQFAIYGSTKMQKLMRFIQFRINGLHLVSLLEEMITTVGHHDTTLPAVKTTIYLPS